VIYITLPSPKYFKQEKKANDLISRLDLGSIKTQFESPPGEEIETAEGILGHNPFALPDHVAFYDAGRKIGALYFMEEPMEVRTLDPSFKPYAQELKIRLKKR
jgi:hypothetical protein